MTEEKVPSEGKSSGDLGRLPICSAPANFGQVSNVPLLSKNHFYGLRKEKMHSKIDYIPRWCIHIEAKMRWWNNALGEILVGKSRSIGCLPPRVHHPYFQKLMELHPYFAYFQKFIGGPTLSSLIRVALHVAYCLSFTFASLWSLPVAPHPFSNYLPLSFVIINIISEQLLFWLSSSWKNWW